MFYQAKLAFDEALEARTCPRCLPDRHLDQLLDPHFHVRYRRIRPEYDAIIFHHHREGQVNVACRLKGKARNDGIWIEATSLDEALNGLERVIQAAKEVYSTGS